MPRGEVGFTGLVAFGAGVAVGANWPRASNIVVYLLKRLGVELTDLAFWISEPEQGTVLSPKTAVAKRPKARRMPQVSAGIEAGNPARGKTHAKATKTARSSRVESGVAVLRTSHKKATHAHPSGMEPHGLNGHAARTVAMPKKKVNSKELPPTARPGRKSRTFAGAVLPVAAALN
jgi:hypothetical protein